MRYLSSSRVYRLNNYFPAIMYSFAQLSGMDVCFYHKGIARYEYWNLQEDVTCVSEDKNYGKMEFFCAAFGQYYSTEVLHWVNEEHSIQYQEACTSGPEVPCAGCDHLLVWLPQVNANRTVPGKQYSSPPLILPKNITSSLERYPLVRIKGIWIAKYLSLLERCFLWRCIVYIMG